MPEIELPINELEFTFARSSGAGGQNVNKVNSKAVLRWAVRDTRQLPDDVKVRFLHRYANRITTDGDLVLSSQRYRDQYRNVDDCLSKLQAMVDAVAAPPLPRKPTRPAKAAKEKRMDDKRETSIRKQGRQRPQLSD